MARITTIRWNRRAFWITLALFGTMNAAHFLYFWSRPIEPIHSRRETRMGRTEPDWIERAVIGLNLPGCYIAMAILSTAGANSQIGFVASSESFATLFWATVAAIIVSPGKPPAPNPDAPSETN
jgi:hypothetical protein